MVGRLCRFFRIQVKEEKKMKKYESVTGELMSHFTMMPNQRNPVLSQGVRRGYVRLMPQPHTQAGYKPLMWLMVLLLAALLAGCGRGSSDPILGGGGSPAAGTLTDTTRPRVTNTIPANLAPAVASVPTNAAITATFTEAMLPATITAAGTFTVMDTTTSVAVSAVAVTYDAASRTATFKHAAFTPSDNYTATITTAATDLAGNALAGNQAALPAASDYVWSFTAAAVADNTRPTITLTTPADGASGVALNKSVNATFSEAMDATTLDTASFTLAASGVPPVPVSGVVTYDQVNHIATFNPSGNLQPSTTYTATVTNAATDLAGNALLVPAAGLPGNPWTFTTGTGLAPGTIALGSAGTFGLMATSAITSTGNSIINGDVSLDPGTSMTGFPPAIVNGAIHINDTVSAQARQDLLQAYNQAKTLPPGTIISAGADLGSSGLYPAGIPPGTYTSGSTMLVSSPLLLDAGGDANAVWVFQIGSSLTTSANVTLANGAQAKNVFWVPTSDATIGVGSTFEGTIVAGRDVTAITGATINGRILAGAITAGTIALQNATVNVPAP
jgi:hypothetical protein